MTDDLAAHGKAIAESGKYLSKAATNGDLFGTAGADHVAIDDPRPPSQSDWADPYADVPPPTDEPGNDSADDETPVYADRILTRSALRNLPDPEPLIDNVLDQGTTALLYGKWGTAKSFTALDWAASVATGRRWQNRHTEQRRGLYVAGEGAFGFKGRTDAWEAGWHTKIGDDDLHILPFAVNLTRPLEVANLAALVDWGGYSFIVLDTLARCMVGADENSAKDCGIVVDSMTRLLNHTPGGRGVVLGVHHAGKDGKTMRGSSAFEGGVDTMYFAARDGEAIILSRQKRKDGPEADRHELRLGQIECTGSCVIELHLATATTGRGQTLSCTYNSCFAATGCTATQLREAAEADGMARHTFYRALNDLLESGYLVHVTESDTRPFYKRPGDE